MSLIVVVQNVSNLAPVSDYQYDVMVGDGTQEGSHTIAQGRVEKHKRSDGWQKLVAKVLKKEKPK